MFCDFKFLRKPFAEANGKCVSAHTGWVRTYIRLYPDKVQEEGDHCSFLLGLNTKFIVNIFF